MVFCRKDLCEAKPGYGVQNFAQNRPLCPESTLPRGGGLGGIWSGKLDSGKVQSTEA